MIFTKETSEVLNFTESFENIAEITKRYENIAEFTEWNDSIEKRRSTPYIPCKSVYGKECLNYTRKYCNVMYICPRYVGSN